MKKTIKVVILILISLMLISCSNSDDIDGFDKGKNGLRYTITFDSNGGSPVSSLKKEENSLVNKPSDPSRKDYVFLGWFQDENLSITVNWPYKITENRTFYAGWDLKPLTSSEISNLFKDSVFKIKIQDSNKMTVSQGSGFIIKSDGTFVTNAHVMKGAWYAYADFDEIVTDYEIEWIYVHDNERDYSIGRIKTNFGRTFKPVEFTQNYGVKTKVYSIGYPNNSYKRVVKSGEVLDTNYRVRGSSIDYIKTSADIDHGSSGGILATTEGKVIGMTTSGFNDGFYGSIPERYFSHWATTSTTPTGKSPIDYFHPETKIMITTANVSSYIDVKVNLTSSSFDYGIIRANYNVTATFKGGKEWYLPQFSYTGISIYVQIRIDYSYKTSYGFTTNMYRTQIVNLKFYSLNGTFGATNVTGHTYFSINFGSNNTLTNVKDSWSMVSVSGSIARRK